MFTFRYDRARLLWLLNECCEWLHCFDGSLFCFPAYFDSSIGEWGLRFFGGCRWWLSTLFVGHDWRQFHFHVFFFLFIFDIYIVLYILIYLFIFCVQIQHRLGWPGTPGRCQVTPTRLELWTRLRDPAWPGITRLFTRRIYASGRSYLSRRVRFFFPIHPRHGQVVIGCLGNLHPFAPHIASITFTSPPLIPFSRTSSYRRSSSSRLILKN